MTYGIPLGLGLFGLAIIAFVLWEMFRKPKDEPDKRALMRAIAGEMKLDASTIIDLPEGKTVDDVRADNPLAYDRWNQFMAAEGAQFMAEVKRMREMG